MVSENLGLVLGNILVFEKKQNLFLLKKQTFQFLKTLICFFFLNLNISIVWIIFFIYSVNDSLCNVLNEEDVFLFLQRMSLSLKPSIKFFSRQYV